MKLRIVIILMAIVIVWNMSADVPATINFQGALKDANGEPVNDTKIIQFLIYDDETAGSVVWSEYQNSVEIVDGIFSIELGSETVFPEELFQESELWMTFQLGGAEMTPRQRILAVPYAIQSDQANHSINSDEAIHSIFSDEATHALDSETIEDVALSGLVQQDGNGNAAISGTMTATTFTGNGSGLTGLSDLLDDVYVNETGPETITANSSLGVLNISNTFATGKGIQVQDAGDGIYIDSVEYDGVEILSAGDNGIEINEVADDGVYVYHSGNPSSHHSNNLSNGLEVAGAEGHGLYVGRADDDGIYVNSAGEDGVHVYNTGTPSTQLTSEYKNGVEVAGTEGNGLYVGRADLNGINIHSSGNDGVRVFNSGNPSMTDHSIANNGFEVNGAEGNGLFVGQADENGVYVRQADEDGVNVLSAGAPSFLFPSDFANNGFEVAGAEENGLYVGWADLDGVHIANSGRDGFSISGAERFGLGIGTALEDGIYVNSAGNDGVHVYSAGSPDTHNESEFDSGFEVAGSGGDGLFVGRADMAGVFIQSSGSQGIYIYESGSTAIYIGSTGNYGIYISESVNDGVYANTTDINDEYGFYTPNKIYAGAGYYPARSGTYVRNIGNTSLEPGDIVCLAGGYEENVLGRGGVPVINVQQADRNNAKSVIGVVEYKVYIREEIEELRDGKTDIRKSFRFAEGKANSGDYLAIVVQGPADVKVDKTENIETGDLLTVRNGKGTKVRTTEVNGLTIAENVGIIGKAMEDSNGKEKLKVFVNCK